MYKIMLMVMLISFSASIFDVLGKDTEAALTDNSDDWEHYYDTRLGFIIDHPAGWTVQTQGYNIVAQNADHSSFVMIEAFAVNAGETAKVRINTISALHPLLFPNARIERVTQQAAQNDQAAGAMSFRNVRGQSAQVRVLCSINQGSGIIYAMAAPDNRFTTERATLLRILMSIRFGPTPAESNSSAKKGTSAASSNNLRFIRWTDPKEHAYTVEVPQGWMIDGGAFRIEPSDIRMMNRIVSPEKDMVVQIGDQTLPATLLPPTPLNMRTYPNVPEAVPFSPNHTSQMMILRYMPALDFNKWYLDKVIVQGIEDISVIRAQEMPEVAQRINEALSNTLGAAWQAKVTVAQTEFKGRSKQTGKPVIGMMFSTISIQASRNSPLVVWNAKPSFMICVADDKQEAHQQMLLEILMRLNQSYQQDPAFTKRYNEQVTGDTKDLIKKGDESIERSKETTAAIARNAEINRQSIMGSYWAKNNSQGDFNRKFNNYIGDNTDVNDPTTGQSYKVGSGYSNYYLDSRSGKIIGTNSASHPGIDFTLLKEY